MEWGKTQQGSALGYDIDSSSALSESTQYNRKSKGSTENSEATRKEKLDEIKALQPTRCPSSSEHDIESMLNTVSLQNDYLLND